MWIGFKFVTNFFIIFLFPVTDIIIFTSYILINTDNYELLNSSTVCSGIEWNSMLGLLVRLKKAKRNKEYLLIGTGAYLGLRASDLLNLRWSDLMGKDEIAITEKKTGKHRHITINTSLKDILMVCFRGAGKARRSSISMHTLFA